MCKFCARIGNRYHDQLPSNLRPFVDAARQASNFPRLPKELLPSVIGGISIASQFRTVASASLFGDSVHAEVFASLSAQMPNIEVLAFETHDNELPGLAVFLELQKVAPKATILRIIHGNGNVQIWEFAEVLSHFNPGNFGSKATYPNDETALVCTS
jgi:hypothetical protein